MLAFLADENFNNVILRGVVRRHPDIDIVRAQDVGLSGADDPTLLSWAAEQSRLVLTHDAQTLVNFAYHRVRDSQLMPGVIECRHRLPIAQAIDDIAMLAEASLDGEWEGQVVYLPL